MHKPYGTVWIKLLNIIICCIAIWFTGVAADRLGGAHASVIATVLAGTSAYLIKYAAFTFRMYGLFFLLTVLMVIAYHNRLKKPDKPSAYIVYGIILTLLLYTHYFSVLIIACAVIIDICLHLKKKITEYAALPYIGACFIGLLWYAPIALNSFAFNGFWPEVPNFQSLLTEFNKFANEQNITLVAFVFVAIVLILVVPATGIMVKFKNSPASTYALVLCVASTVFVLFFTFFYSRFINRQASVFVSRYFTGVYACFAIAASVGYVWLTGLFCLGKSVKFKRLVNGILMGCLFIFNLCFTVGALSTFAGTMDEPFEQVIETVYAQGDALSDNTLVIMGTGFANGLYYYGSHNGERENLNFGRLEDINWQKYNVVYAGSIHHPLLEDDQIILDKYYKPVQTFEGLPLIKYVKKTNVE